MVRSAETLHRTAVELANRGRRTAAERLLTLASERTDDPALLARIAGTIAVGRAHRGALDDAERMCRDAMRTPGLDSGTVALLAGQMGSIMELAGRLDEADRWLSDAIGRVDDPVAQANLRVNRSVVSMQRGRLDDAAGDLAAAAAAFSDDGRDVDAAEARHNLGYIDLLRGDLVIALREMSAAHDVIAAASAVVGAVTDVDRAEVLRDAGLIRDAEALLARAAGTLGANRVPRARAEAEFHLARSLLEHDPDAARRVARASARRFEALGNSPWAARAQGLRVRAELAGGKLLPRGGRAPDPRRVPGPHEVEATAIRLEQHGFRSDAAAVRIAGEAWAIRRGRSVASRPVRVPRQATVEVRMLVHELRALRAAARGREAEARRHAAQGLDVLSSWQRAFGSLDLQTSVAMHGRELLLSGLESAIRSGRPEVVFEWSERTRHLGQHVVPLRPPPDPEWAEELAELRRLRSEDPSWLDSPRAAELREHARERQWTGTLAAAYEERVSLDELRTHLDDDTALITYVFSGLGLTALVVTRTRARMLPITDFPTVRRALSGLRADLDMVATMRGGVMAAAVQRSLAARLAQLSGALVDEAMAMTGDAGRVVITAPGLLSGVPWGMLPALRGRAFTLAVSATRWAHLRASPAPPAAAVGLVAGPRVARADEEVGVATRAWRTSTSTLRGLEASVSAVTALAHRVDVLHVAAHGRHAAENPLFSGLELADGTLFGYDIDLIPSVPTTVVLSACEVGRSSVRWGEEAIGMTRIWLHAGTRCVIASPVVVADDDACELLGAMHEGLAAGSSPAVALSDASSRTGIVAPFQAHGAGF